MSTRWNRGDRSDAKLSSGRGYREYARFVDNGGSGEVLPLVSRKSAQICHLCFMSPRFPTETFR